MERPYHKYVFDTDKKEFVGKFEEMYQSETVDGYDSWYQETLTTLGKQLSLTILQRHNFQRVLDIGCGKGTFTHLLKKVNNQVIGIDLSETAIARARAKYDDIEFLQLDTSQIDSLSPARFDLVVAMEVFSYLKDWRELLKSIAAMTEYLYLALYIPPDPIGYVKSFDELISELSRHFSIEVELLVNRDQMLVLAKSGTKASQNR